MGRFFSLLSIVLVFSVFVDSAFANQGDPFTNGENDRAYLNTMQDISGLPTLPPSQINPATGSPYTTVEEYNGVNKARMRFGALPALNALGVITMTGTTLYTAYEIGDFLRAKISGDSGISPGAMVPKWTSYCSAGAGENGSSCSLTSYSSSRAYCGAAGGTIAVGSATNSCLSVGWLLSDQLNNKEFGVGAFSCGVATATNAVVASIVAAGNATAHIDSTGQCQIVTRDIKQMYAAVKEETCNTACYNGANTKVDQSTFNTNNTTNNYIGSQTQCGGFLGSTVGSAEQEACRAAMNYAVNPACNTDGSHCVGSATGSTTVIGGTSGGGGSSFIPFVIPEPVSTETYGDYMQRLRDKGYIGTVTITPVSVDSTLTGASGVVSVSDTTASLGPNSITAWPTNPFTIPAASDAVELKVNSTSAPEVTPPDTTKGIDWTPLEGLSLGSKFPFGIPSWIESVFPTFTSSCPTLSIGKPSALGGGTIDIPWCSTEWETTYRPIVFPILQILIVIAGVVFLAGKLTGIGDTDTDGG